MRRLRRAIHPPIPLVAAAVLTTIVLGAGPAHQSVVRPLTAGAGTSAGSGVTANGTLSARVFDRSVSHAGTATSSALARAAAAQTRAAAAPVADAEQVAYRTRSVKWGFYTDSFPGDPTAIDRIASSAGRNPNYVMWYVHWGGPWNAINLADVQAVLTRGATPLITWMSDDPTLGGDAFPLAKIAAGDFDAYIWDWATTLAVAGGPVLLRFDHEMNGSWYPWSPGVGASTASDYVAAWRHVHDMFAWAGAYNVRFVWSPNVEYTGSTSLESLYPGDGYVAWVGIDGYNWGSLHPWTGWQSPTTVFGPTISHIRSSITYRPLMLSEVGCATTPGDKAAWINSFFSMLQSYRSIAAFVWFDVNKETDWRFNSSSAALSAFQIGLSQTR